MLTAPWSQIKSKPVRSAGSILKGFREAVGKYQKCSDADGGKKSNFNIFFGNTRFYTRASSRAVSRHGKVQKQCDNALKA